MCLSKAYVEKDGKNKLLMADIASVQVKGDKLVMKSLFGDKKEITAAIREIDFTHSVLKVDISGEGLPVD